ncbi:MAG TPA: hypothetical protein ENN90_02085 [Mariniphaga anaerophila]|uniref:Uncharacterized protein n=1 Tax=Mariniphaga anaerophila TaxID=1484053 RepID=A0A831LFR3_9BACT|nr:hypothetical protein [Mariniphaga anaerophila]
MEHSEIVFSSMHLVLFFVLEVTAWFFTTGGKVAFLILLGLSGLVIYQTQNRFAKKNQLTDTEDIVSENDSVEKILQKCKEQLIHFLNKTCAIYSSGVERFTHEDLSGLKSVLHEKNKLGKKVEKSKENIFTIATRFESELPYGHYFIELKDSQARMIHSLSLILHPLFEHLSNHHKPFIKAQVEDLNKLENGIKNIFDLLSKSLNNSQVSKDKNLTGFQNNIYEQLNSMEVDQIKRIKSNQVNTRNSILFLNVLSETRNLLYHASALHNSYIKLVTDSKNKKLTQL